MPDHVYIVQSGNAANGYEEEITLFSKWYEQYDNRYGYPKEFDDKNLKQMEAEMKNGYESGQHFVIYYLDGRVVSSRGRIINQNADRWK
jgi:hypothetical protein